MRLAIGIYAFAGGAVTLIGWMTSNPRLTDWPGDGISMLPNAAVCSMAVGLATLLVASGGSTVLIRALGAVAALIGAATLAEHLTGVSWGIDRLLLFREWGQRGTLSPGRMGPPGSLAWTLVGLAMLMHSARASLQRAAIVAAGLALLLASLSLVGYLYGATAFYTVPKLTTIALQTASMVFALSSGVILSLADRQPVKTLLAASTAGLLARRALPAVCVLPVLVGWLRVRGQRAGLFDTASGTAVRTMVELVLLAILLWWTLAKVATKEEALKYEKERANRVFVDMAFLAAVSHQLGALETVDEIMRTVGAKIGEHFRLTFCNFAEVRESEGLLVVTHDWHRNDVPSSVGEYAQADYLTKEFQSVCRAGQIFVVRDTATDPRTDAAKYAALKMRAFVCIPIVQEGVWRFFISCIDAEPRDWSGEELELLRELTNRIWTRLEQVRADQVLRTSQTAVVESEQRFRALANAMPQLAWIARGDGFIDWYNDRWYDYTGTTPEQMSGWGWQAVHDPSTLPAVIEAWQKSIATGEPFEMTFPLRSGDGQFRPFLTRVVPMKNAAGQVVQWFGTNTDVERLERVVAERTAQLREMNGELEAFSYSMAHDLRGPLRSMQGFANILSEDYGPQLDEQGRGYLQRISAAADRMQRLLSDVLSYSRVTRDELPLGPVALHPLLQSILEEYPTLQDTSIRIVGELPAVQGNPAAITQALSNLLTNAVKFVPPGRVPQVQVGARTDGEWVELWIQDNGIGIAPEHQERIFGMFERIPAGGKYEGTGIGLAIVRRAVERMGGKVGVESTLGSGSRFWVRLRRAEQPL